MHVSGHANSEEIRTLLALVRPKAVMPVHGEFRMQAAHARMAGDAGVPADVDRARRERLGRRARAERAPRSSTASRPGVTFVDGLGVGDICDVALRDRRHLSEDGVLIIVATLASSNGARTAAPELIARGFAEQRAAPRRDARGGGERAERAASPTTSSRSSSSRSTCTTASGSSSTTAPGRRPMILPVVVEV